MFWDKLINLCKNKNVSPNKMCADLGLSTAIATKWKSGSVPRSTTILQIADYFGVEVNYFEEKTPPGDDPEGVDKIDAEILTVFSKLSDDKKQQAISYLEFLAQGNGDK